MSKSKIYDLSCEDRVRIINEFAVKFLSESSYVGKGLCVLVKVLLSKHYITDKEKRSMDLFIANKVTQSSLLNSRSNEYLFPCSIENVPKRMYVLNEMLGVVIKDCLRK